ncbi:MAG: glycerol kinase GlpK, partial [Candidatus Uhrbacteria bacterium]
MSLKSKYILALDLGTTSVRAMIFDSKLVIKAVSQKSIKISYPEPGWVEQDAEEIFYLAKQVMREALRQSKIKAEQIAGIGITNQRETTVLWNIRTGRPVAPAIVWQDRRTADMCQRLEKDGLESMIRHKTGLVIDPYFSATKLRWLLTHMANRVSHIDLRFGTIDSWIIWKLTGQRVHATDVSNASRTMMFNINDRCWDAELLKLFRIPAGILPTVLPSATIFGETERSILGKSVPISGVLGDQQAALFGQTCFKKGQMKNTYGTGAFLLLNTGNKPVITKEPLLATIAWQIKDQVTYALEGGVFACGSVVNWLKDEIGVINEAADTDHLAQTIKGNDEVYFVPAFNGLGAPYWDPLARGMIIGLTQGTGKAQLARAALEGIAHQTTDVIEAMKQGSGLSPKQIRVDGGVSKNNFAMQCQ